MYNRKRTKKLKEQKTFQKNLKNIGMKNSRGMNKDSSRT